MADCGWPFHNQPGCPSCEQWERLAGKNLDDWLAAKAESKRSKCRSGCPSQDHASYKACLQAMRVGIAPGDSAGGQW